MRTGEEFEELRFTKFYELEIDWISGFKSEERCQKER